MKIVCKIIRCINVNRKNKEFGKSCNEQACLLLERSHIKKTGEHCASGLSISMYEKEIGVLKAYIK